MTRADLAHRLAVIAAATVAGGPAAQIGAHLAAAHDKVLIVSITEDYAGAG